MIFLRCTISHLPDLISFLLRWQTLIGVCVSGSLSMMVAYIVGIRPRRFEEKAAALFLIQNLHLVRAAISKVQTMANEKYPKEESKHQYMATIYSHQGFPKVSELFEKLMLKVVWIDLELAAHMGLIKTHLDLIDEALHRFDKSESLLKVNPNDIAAKENIAHYSTLIWKLSDKTLRHMDCACPLLEKLFINTRFGLNRMFLDKCKSNACKQLLENP